MRHNDDAFCAMLLTLPLTANKEELVRPLSSAEYAQLAERVESTPVRRIGGLIGMDISGIMRALGVAESEAYRLCMLLSRTMPLSYAMERFYEQNLEILTLPDTAYPERLISRLGQDAPPALYACGDLRLLHEPLIGILGIAGVKMDENVKRGVGALVEGVRKEGFGIITSSELGACRFAETEAIRLGVPAVCVLAGDLMTRKEEETYAEAIAQKRLLMLSLVHPDAPYTAVHALSRNRLVYAMSISAFIATTDGKRGEGEALRRRLCDWIYAFDCATPPGNRVVIGRGATALYDAEPATFDKLARNWRMARAEQLSFL